MAKYFTYKNVEYSVGDTVKAMLNVTEGEKTRQQAFEGIVIAVSNRESGKAITLRKIASGVGVERILPLDGPAIADLAIVTKGDVRRGKLYYMRGRAGKNAMKIKKLDVASPQQ
ncbi:MAG TPA: 50S ribosomal protein L19 [Patescibacteria group bacterium]|nr:50S ribosomal protein L19 [Patescibacteria group bacterium]